MHKIPPPSSSRRKVTVAEDGIDESRESVQDIKVATCTLLITACCPLPNAQLNSEFYCAAASVQERMQRQIEERRSERSRRQGNSFAAESVWTITPALAPPAHHF